jgi:RHS repeat-associated protein
LTNTISPLGRQTKQIYNDRGLLQSVIEPSTDTANLYYDARGRLTNRTDNLGTILYRYDANNNRTNVTEAGKTNSWTFDAYDRVSSYRDSDGNLIQYRTDANGNLASLIYPGGKTVNYAFDSLNRLTNVTDWANRKTTIEYNLAGRVRKITRPNGTVREINYDTASQMTNIVERLTNNAPIAFFKLNWNAAARMEWEFAAPLPHAYTPPTRTMTYDDDNRIATFNGNNVTYDLDGNMTSGPLTNNTFSSYAYDARNRLLSAGGLTYSYDPAGNRVAITNGANVTKLVVNPSGALSQVLMRVKNGVTNYYVYGLGLLYEADDAGNTKTYHYDYRGSTVAITDGAGNLTDRIEYSAYGTITYRTGNTDTPFLFNGRYGVETDANGLLYMRARYYNPYICRFLNPDPSAFSGGLNFYAAFDGNPVSLIDPFGLLSWSDVGDYFSDVGQVFVGYGQAVGDTVTGLYNVVRHPVNTTVGLYNVATHPVQAFNGITTAIGDTWNSGLQGQGRIVGNVLIAAGTVGAGYAKGVQAAGAAGEGLEFSHWIPARAGGPSSIWNGNYVTVAEHALSDPYRYRFMSAAWKAENPMPNALVQQWNRIPEVYIGIAEGAAIPAASSAGQLGSWNDTGPINFGSQNTTFNGGIK